jgi:2-haloacid dehalogenase
VNDSLAVGETLAVDALVFDVYGTLVDTGSIAAECERVFPGRGTNICETWRSKQLQYTWLLNSMGEYLDFREVTRRALVFSFRSLGLGCDEGNVSSLLDAYLLLVLSNGTPGMLDGVLTNSGLLPHFEAIMSVEAVGVFKPDPKVYSLAADRLGLPLNRIGFVSANSWDIAGASSFGFAAAWLNRTGGVADEVGGTATIEIDSLSGLAASVRNSGR